MRLSVALLTMVCVCESIDPDALCHAPYPQAGVTVYRNSPSGVDNVECAGSFVGFPGDERSFTVLTAARCCSIDGSHSTTCNTHFGARVDTPREKHTELGPVHELCVIYYGPRQVVWAPMDPGTRATAVEAWCMFKVTTDYRASPTFMYPTLPATTVFDGMLPWQPGPDPSGTMYMVLTGRHPSDLTYMAADLHHVASLGLEDTGAIAGEMTSCDGGAANMAMRGTPVILMGAPPRVLDPGRPAASSVHYRDENYHAIGFVGEDGVIFHVTMAMHRTLTLFKTSSMFGRFMTYNLPFSRSESRSIAVEAAPAVHDRLWMQHREPPEHRTPRYGSSDDRWTCSAWRGDPAAPSQVVRPIYSRRVLQKDYVHGAVVMVELATGAVCTGFWVRDPRRPTTNCEWTRLLVTHARCAGSTTVLVIGADHQTYRVPLRPIRGVTEPWAGSLYAVLYSPSYKTASFLVLDQLPAEVLGACGSSGDLGIVEPIAFMESRNRVKEVRTAARRVEREATEAIGLWRYRSPLVGCRGASNVVLEIGCHGLDLKPPFSEGNSNDMAMLGAPVMWYPPGQVASAVQPMRRPRVHGMFVGQDDVGTGGLAVTIPRELEERIQSASDRTHGPAPTYWECIRSNLEYNFCAVKGCPFYDPTL